MNFFTKDSAVICRETKVLFEISISFLAFSMEFSIVDNREEWVVMFKDSIIYRGNNRFECENYCNENGISVE